MSNRIKVPPTKNALLDLRRQVIFLQQGFSLLERKRELLTRLVHEHLAIYRDLRQETFKILKETYAWLRRVQMTTTGRTLRQAAMMIEPAVHLTILQKSSLGVTYPSVSIEEKRLQPVTMMETGGDFDEARRHLVRLTLLLARLGEAETSLRRMMAEQRKTQKRVNALQYNVIPRYQETIRFIESALEEEERNTLFQIKRLKEMARP